MRPGINFRIIITVFLISISLFFGTQNVSAQYPTNTPIVWPPEFYCHDNVEGQKCYDSNLCTCADVCSIGGYTPANCPGGALQQPSHTCQGVTTPITSSNNCGTCYCTSNAPGVSCPAWSACYWDPSYGGHWVQTRFCDIVTSSGTCKCSDNPDCCKYQIQTPCDPGGTGTSGASGSSGSTGSTGTSGPTGSVPTNTPPVGYISNTPPPPTVTPGGPTSMPTSTPIIGGCRILGRKLIYSTANICKDTTNYFCKPADEFSTSVVGLMTIPGGSFLYDTGGGIPVGNYTIQSSLSPGYTINYQITSTGPWTPGNSVTLACPGDVRVNWRYQPALGSITVKAKKTASFTCLANTAAMNGLTDLTGTQVGLGKYYYADNNVIGIKSWDFTDDNPNTELKNPDTSAVWSNVVIPDFTHFLTGHNIPTGWTHTGNCWYNTGTGALIGSNPLSDGNTGLWSGTNNVTAYMLYTPPGIWSQTGTGDVYASNKLHSGIPSTPYMYSQAIAAAGGFPGFITYNGNLSDSFDVYGSGAQYGFEDATNTLSNTRWLVKDGFAPKTFYDDILFSIGGLTSNTNFSPGGNPVTTADIISNCPNDGVCVISGNIRTGAISLGANNKYIIVIKKDLSNNASLTIENNIRLAGNAFIAFIVDGNISVNSSVGTAAGGPYYVAGGAVASHIDGLYAASGAFSVPSSGGTDGQLIGKGIFLADSFSFNRDLKLDNATNPGVVFVHDPRLLFDMPRVLWNTDVRQGEVEPRWPTPTP